MKILILTRRHTSRRQCALHSYRWKNLKISQLESLLSTSVVWRREVRHAVTKPLGKTGTSVFTVTTERRHIPDDLRRRRKDGKARRWLRQMTLRTWLSEFQRIIVCYVLHNLCSSRCNTRHQGTMTYHLHHGCTNGENLIAQVTKFCTVDPRISAQSLQLFSYVKTRICSHAPSRNRQMTDSKITPELCALSMDPAACHPCGVSNLEVAPRFLGKFVYPWLKWRCNVAREREVLKTWPVNINNLISSRQFEILI